MSAAQATADGDPNRLGHGSGPDQGTEARLSHGGDHADRRIVAGYGFWIFLLSDFIMFAAFFATYAVLADQTDGGPAGRDLFSLPNVAIETACLLLSSFTCGLAGIAADIRRPSWFYAAMAVTCLLGMAFLALELREFVDMVEHGAGPSRSAFLSAFFALVGCHGLHVTIGIMWLLTMMAQVFAKGFREDIMRRVLCFNLFWHALDIIWVAVFSIVYLIGVAP